MAGMLTRVPWWRCDLRRGDPAHNVIRVHDAHVPATSNNSFSVSLPKTAYIYPKPLTNNVKLSHQ